MAASKTHRKSIKDELERPPPYSLTAQEGAGVQDDGRVDVNLDSRTCRAVANLLRWPGEEDLLHPPPSYSAIAPYSIRLNIVLQVVGSRGDIQPFIALGNELQRYGHRVRLATHDAFRSMVLGSGLEFYPIGGDPAELMAYMVKNPGLIPSMKSLRVGEIQHKRAMIQEMLHGLWRSCIEDDPITSAPFVADAIIANPPSFAHVHCAQALGIPVHLMFTMPWSPTVAYPHPLANITYSGSNLKFANSVSYGIVEWLTWQGLGDVINDWRSTIDLESVPATEGPNLAQTLQIPFTYCWSPSLLSKPQDWPSYVDVCGFFFREPPIYQPDAELELFLSSGPAPIYVGFGSIVVEDPARLTSIIQQAVREAGVRAIVSHGWSKLEGPSSSEILYIGDCPHEFLFQHVSAVVHHGGAGTTACGLRYGRPTVIVPFFGDQPFWGSVVVATGAGPEPIPHRLLTAENLCNSIQHCFTPQVMKAAEHISIKMQAEHGVKSAVDSFHRNLPLDRMRCDIFPDQPAVWVYRRSRTKSVFLSKLASQILSEHMKVDAKNLELHETRSIIIQNRRYDPLSSTISAALGTGSDMVKATTDMFVKPYEEASRGRSGHTGPSRARSTSPLTRTPAATTGAVIAASAKGFGRFLGHYYKGIIVDIPLAATEGLRAVPRLYGEEVEDYVVRDWRSGAIAGGKNFVTGMRDGFTDVWTQPMKAASEEGAVGVAKGLLKGTVSLTTKVPSAALGLIAYPAHGLCKTLHLAVRSTTSRRIVKARLREGAFVACNKLPPGLDRMRVLRDFDALASRKVLEVSE